MKKQNKQKKPKIVYVEDDGHTVYSMDNVVNDGRKKDKERVKLARKEKFAAIRAALAVYLPRLLLVIGCFVLVGLLMYFWLR